jgi:6-phosphogluconolactonase
MNAQSDSPLTVQVYPDRLALAQATAKEFAHQARLAVEERGRFLVCLSGGTTPLEAYRLLAEPPYSIELPWERMFFFWGDERLVPPDDPGSNYGQAAQVLLSHVAVRPEQVLRVRGELPPHQAVIDYADQLRRLAAPGLDWPKFDLALLGLGADGHTASLFPRAQVVLQSKEPVIAVYAEYEGRPAERLTLTPPVFNTARKVLFLVAGSEKAAALVASLDPCSDPLVWPACRIRPSESQVVWLVDQAAAAWVI